MDRDFERYFDSSRRAEPDTVKDVDMRIEELSNRRQAILAAAEKYMDPKDERLVELANNAGEYHGMLVTTRERVTELQKENAILRSDRDTKAATLDHATAEMKKWEDRARAAESRVMVLEDELKRSKRRKRKSR